MRRTIVITALSLLTVGFLAAAFYTLRGEPDVNSDATMLEPLPGGSESAALRLTVLNNGIASVSAEQIRQALLPVTDLSAETLSLTRNGEPVPFHVVGDLEEGALYFYAQVMTNTLDAPVVYWLAPGTGMAMNTSDAAPTAEGTPIGKQIYHWEQNENFLAQATNDDVWLGPRIFAPTEFPITINDLDPVASEGKLTVHVWSNNAAQPNPDHHLIVTLNGHLLADQTWDGIKSETINGDIPKNILRKGTNTIVLSAPGDTGAAGEAIYIDWIDLEYESNLALNDEQLHFSHPASSVLNNNISILNSSEEALVFDITEPDRPILLTDLEYGDDSVTFLGSGVGSQYIALEPDSAHHIPMTVAPQWERTLRSPDNTADYIAIVADVTGFEEALQPLIAHREGQGATTMVVSAQQVFDEFGFGRQTPQALRDFLAYAYGNWKLPPRFALLVGDATYDVYDFENGQNANLLPTFLVYTTFAGHVASDTLFGIFEDDSLEPQIAIGRFPAQNIEQLNTMVEKTIAYETSAPEEWQGHALLVSDDEPHFDLASDRLADALDNGGYEVQKLYMTENEDIRDAIMGAINNGVGLINYIGHGSVRVWGDEKVFQASDAETLINIKRLPIFTTFTCLNGYFNHPIDDALAEALLWAEDGGIVAAIAPSGRSLPDQQEPLSDEFYKDLLSGETVTLGEALMAAKQASADDPSLAEVIHTFNLLGDPALRFRLP
ncbi:MAG: C25 family cysteine peptidase [Anaerolineae bacterium]|nr:C25 family cysteine peptidase [Anaerolineae bacterium]